MLNLPERPNDLREKARAHRRHAAEETDPARRRAYLLIAEEYDRLADAIEAESGHAMQGLGRAQNGAQSSSDLN